MSALVDYSVENHIAIVRMDDGKANALSKPMIDAVGESLARAEQEASAMVLAGREHRFCAGFDLRVMMSGPDAAKDLLIAGAQLLMKLYGAQIPVVIACTGHALAGGALVVLTGDYRIGTTGAYNVGLNEVSIGMPVPVLAMELARDRLHPSELVRATLLAQIYDPDAALRAGYFDAVASPESVLDQARSHAARLGALSRMAFRATKTRLRGKTIAHIMSSLDADMRELAMPSA